MANEKKNVVVEFEQVPFANLGEDERVLIEEENESFDDGDSYVVWQRVETYEFVHSWGEGMEIERAVYLDSGRIVCLLDHFPIVTSVCNCGGSTVVKNAVLDLLKKEAIDAGLPEVHPTPYMTWRELRNRLNELPDRVLDMTAWVYVHSDSGLDGEIGITSVTPYDNGPDSTINDGPEFSNHLNINIDD